MIYSQPQQVYFAHWLTRRLPSSSLGKLTASLQDAQVDLTPHQIDAALFAFKSPLSKGAILADEVGLGKTIEAGIILSQFWAEHKRRLLVIAPANLRKQWSAELSEKFFLPSRILESKTFNAYIEDDSLNPFDCEEIVICSYQFAKAKAAYLSRTPWDLVVIDEAHRLRNVYKPANKTANALKRALENRKKILLTATPLQNSILELYGLTSIIDDYAFGDLKSFKMQYNHNLSDTDYANLRSRLAPLCKRTLRRQALEYVRYTKRIAILQEFFPSKQEQELYDCVSEYLQRPKLYALPNSQRQLMTLILRKLLASSTHAIYGTICALLERLEAKLARHTVDPDMPSLFSQDYEGYDEDSDEWLDEDEENNTEDEIFSPHDIECIRREIADLEKFRDVAYSIKRNSKAEQLFEGLRQGFAQLEELGAPKKALIFTESRRTQDFLFDLLEKHGYKGKVVLFNGSNTDKLSSRIYKEWKERYKGTKRITGSVMADKRAALVEYFRNEATIMIATEAAAEGINLQFCSLVVNYDMPWNPQRIEQRIGRCHRYGQKFDVVVINFLNKANAADVRVYELLDQKFQLFNGVFGTSDEVLGAIGNGVDFEKRIAAIYQQCRTTEEIQEAFDTLQSELQEQISEKMLKARTTLLENFDEAVKQKLRTDLVEAQSNLNEFESVLWQLTRSFFDGHALFEEADHSFMIDKVVAHDAKDTDGIIEYGYYVLPPSNNRRNFVLPENSQPYRVGSPLAKHMLNTLLRQKAEPSEIVFDYTGSEINIALLSQLVGFSGWLLVDKLTIESFEREDYFLMACITDSGEAVFPDIAEQMLKLPGESSPLAAEMTPEQQSVLNDAISACRADIVEDNSKRNETFFDEETDKLDSWAEDVKQGLEKELRDLDAEIRLRRSESRRTSRLEERVRIQREIRELEKRRSEKRLNLYQAQDEVDAKREALLDEVEAMLTQKTEQNRILTIHWRIK